MWFYVCLMASDKVSFSLPFANDFIDFVCLYSFVLAKQLRKNQNEHRLMRLQKFKNFRFRVLWISILDNVKNIVTVIVFDQCFYFLTVWIRGVTRVGVTCCGKAMVCHHSSHPPKIKSTMDLLLYQLMRTNGIA